MSTVTAILARIALLQRNILDPVSGLPVKAFDNVPDTISVADMPLFVTFVGPLSRNVLDGSDERGREFIDTRAYNMVLYHSAFGTGISEEKLGLLTPWFDLVYAEFGKWPHLQTLAGIVDAVILNDGGASVQEFIGQQYYGIRFTLQVMRRMRWTLGNAD